MNERVFILRKELNLTQEVFGQRLGVRKTAISKLEKGENNLTEAMIKLICSEFNANEKWLRYGQGDMFVENDSTIVSRLAIDYNLNKLDIKIIESYLNLSSEQRKAIQSYVRSLANAIADEEIAATKENYINDEVEKYRLELEAEQKGEISSVSDATKEKLG